MSEKLSNLPALPTPITTGDNLYVIRGGVSYKADNNDLPSGSGGQVDTITAGDGIQVTGTATDPIVTADMTLQEVLDSGNTATSPDTLSTVEVNLANGLSGKLDAEFVDSGSGFEGRVLASAGNSIISAIKGTQSSSFDAEAIPTINYADGTDTFKVQPQATLPTGATIINYPSPTTAGTYNLARSVNGVEADTTGNVTISAGGTVTSVAVSGSDGIEVDSGSPITTSGTIALGVNKATLLAHLGLSDEYHLSFAFGGEDEDLAVGTAKITFQMPNFATTLTGVSVNVKTAPTGTAATFDLNEGGTSVLSTKITVDATETTSETALIQPVISDSALAANAVMTLDIDAIGTTIAGAGGKAWIYYTRT